MTSVSEKLKSWVGLLGFDTRDEDEDIFEAMENEMGDVEYPTEANAALNAVYATKPKERENSKVVAHPNYRGYEVLVCEPRSYDDSVDIVKQLKERKTIILNLHLLDREQSLRIVDFLCGATHALNGNQQKIGDTVFIFTPNNVALTADTQKNKFLRDAIWSQTQG